MTRVRSRNAISRTNLLADIGLNEELNARMDVGSGRAHRLAKLLAQVDQVNGPHSLAVLHYRLALHFETVALNDPEAMPFHDNWHQMAISHIRLARMSKPGHSRPTDIQAIQAYQGVK